MNALGRARFGVRGKVDLLGTYRHVAAPAGRDHSGLRDRHLGLGPGPFQVRSSKSVVQNGGKKVMKCRPGSVFHCTTRVGPVSTSEVLFGPQ